MVIVVAMNITQRKKNIATIEYKTNYDYLTNLQNRNFLINFILNETGSSPDANQILTLVSIDLDRFKEINESLGQQVGDFILQRVANRLYKATDHSSNELLARLEGDEFVLILPGIEIERANEIAINIKQIISAPITIGSSNISVDCSIGIASFPEHTHDRHALIQYAESAMYTAKANRRGIGIYDAASHKVTTEKLQLVTQLRSAISNNQIVPHYQPIVNMEHPEDWNLLRDMGCDYGQGFWMGVPMPYEALVGWLASNKVFSWFSRHRADILETTIFTRYPQNVN